MVVFRHTCKNPKSCKHACINAYKNKQIYIIVAATQIRWISSGNVSD